MLVSLRAVAEDLAGGGTFAIVSPPGSGTVMMVRRAVPMIPAPTVPQRDSLEAIYYAANMDPPTKAPFRAPHYSVSKVAMIGTQKRPGEVSLAHTGLLFLDEAPEFRVDVMRATMQAVDEGRTREWPAYPRTVVCHVLPCACGWYAQPHPHRQCTCTEARLGHYKRRVEPIMKWVDYIIQLPAITADDAALLTALHKMPT
jgi:magnesium chelatase family protein